MPVVDSVISAANSRLAEECAALAEFLRRSTVQVRDGNRGGGSGVIWRSDGLIVTNAHVVRGRRARVELSDGREFDAKVTAWNAGRDLASLRIEAGDLPAAAIGDSDRLRPGELIFAVGSPFGIAGALTAGIVHAQGPKDGQRGPRWVQADVRLAPGNSGGPLADARGYVIGINSMVANGLAIAVPSNAVERFLRRRGERAYLGVTFRPVLIPQQRQPGLLVLKVDAGSPAKEAGLMMGDVLLSAGGYELGDADDLAEVLSDVAADCKIQLSILRGGSRLTCEVILRARALAEAA